MATIDKDGVYTIKGQEKDVSLQLLKGHVIPDGVEYVRVGDVAPSEAKAEPAPENKAEAAPSTKKA